MFFTQDDYKKIQQWLTKNSVKDTEFNEAILPLNGNEEVAIIQGNHNKKISLKDLAVNINLLGASDFINVSESFNSKYITLQYAISLIPYKSRKLGQVITFLNKDGNWNIYQFKGESLEVWNNITLWYDIVESLYINSILPDEEDLTITAPDIYGNTKLKLKDKRYDSNNFSGLGRVYLRKNIVMIEDAESNTMKEINLLTQHMFSKENTIYIVQYDYNLNGETLIIPEGCTLDFQGGSFSNGTIVGNRTIIQDTLSKIFGLDITIQGTFNLDFARPEWFGAINDGISNSTDAIQKVFDSFLTVKFSRGHYVITRTINCTYCHTFFGSSNQQIYGETAVVLDNPESGNTTAFKLDSKYIPYFSISDICIYGPAPTVENAVFKEGTIGLDTTSGNCVHINNIKLENFEYLIKSDANSYYNKITNSRFCNCRIALFRVNANNIIIRGNRFKTFESAIYMYGDGPATITENSFEEFSCHIINFEYATGSCNISNNYVEIYDSVKVPALIEDRNNGYFGGNFLILGYVKSLTFEHNEMQVNGARRIFMLYNIENFISINNHFIIFDGNCNIEYYFLQPTNDAKLKNFVSLDYLEKRTSSSVVYTQKYNGYGALYTDNANVRNIIGVDPFCDRNFIAYDGATVLFPNKDGGWWFADSAPVFQNRINNGFYFRGKIVRRTDLASVSDDLIATIPLLNLNAIHNYTSYFKTMNGDYEDVILSFNHANGELRIVNGSRDKDIYLDGIVIYDSY